MYDARGNPCPVPEVDAADVVAMADQGVTFDSRWPSQMKLAREVVELRERIRKERSGEIVAG